jgi:hypothetical protein
MDTDAILRLTEADEFRTITIVDVLRSELKRGVSPPIPLKMLFSLLKQRLTGQNSSYSLPSAGSFRGRPSVSTGKVSEEVVTATMQLLVELLHAADSGTLNQKSDFPVPTDEELALGIMTVVPAIMPYISRDRVRRALNVLLVTLLKKGLSAAGDAVTDMLLQDGFASEDVRYSIHACVILVHNSWSLTRFLLPAGRTAKRRADTVRRLVQTGIPRIFGYR